MSSLGFEGGTKEITATGPLAESKAFTGIFTRGKGATVNLRQVRGLGLSPGLAD